LNEAVKQYTIDEIIASIRNNTMFYIENGLRGYRTFESGLCYEFALGLYKFLKSNNEPAELIFLVGNMKKADAAWYDSDEFDPTTEHPFHTIVKVRKYYYDINGRLGTKREIVAIWNKFRRKQLVVTDVNGIKPYIKKPEIVKHLELLFKNAYDYLKMM